MIHSGRVASCAYHAFAGPIQAGFDETILRTRGTGGGGR
jgi:hypothetical protein